MSLYTHEEVCEDCVNAVFHNCCGSFCSCKVDDEINPIDGSCMSKISRYKEDSCECRSYIKTKR